MIFFLALMLPGQNYLADAAPGQVKSTVKIAEGENDGAADLDLVGSEVFGISVANAGDINDDGVVDLVVGATGDEKTNGVDDSEGAIFILFMKTDGTVDSFNKISDALDDGSSDLGITSNENWGISVAGIGDLNGAGAEDIVVGSWRDENTNNGEGAIFVMFMNTNGEAVSFQKVSNGIGDGPSLDAGDQFGYSVTDMGDLNGDGVTDIAVGAIDDEGPGTDEGAVHILFMENDGTVRTTAPTISKIDDSDIGSGDDIADGAEFGFAVANIGDLNGDGVNDLAVGAPNDTGNKGAIWILFLDSSGNVSSDKKIADGVNGGPSVDAGDEFGQSIAVIPDLDGDGVQDLIVGVTDDESDVSPNSAEGAIFVLFMSSDGSVKASLKISDNQNGGPTGLETADGFGRSVTTIGDLDGDGFSEIAVGAWTDESTGGDNAEGAIHILFMEGFSDSSKSLGDKTGTSAIPSFTQFLLPSEYPMTINNSPYTLEDFLQHKKTTVEVGQPVQIKVIASDDGGGDDIQRISLYTNLYGDKRELFDSNTAVSFNNYGEPSIRNTDGIFESAGVSDYADGLKRYVTFDIVFAKKMPTSDIILQVLDEINNWAQVRAVGAIEVVKAESQVQQAEEEIQISQEVDLSNQVKMPNWILQTSESWAISTVSDDSFSKTLQYMIQNDIVKEEKIKDYIFRSGSEASFEIPSWLKNNAGWYIDNVISEKEFLDTIQFLLNEKHIRLND